MDARVAYSGRRIVVETYTAKLPNGRDMAVERVVFPNVVSVLPVAGSYVYFIRQYRPALGIYTLEIPSGVVDKGEEPEEAARRELLEEAGLEARALEKLFEGYVSPGYSTEYAYIYLARDPRPSTQRPEEYEVIEVVKMRLEEAREALLGGKIGDMRAALALSLYLLSR
ncbi:NUDIX hydrolase [Pyrobaculum ferrireducens]|uniref:NUDIX hydrolase n=1 Tax=Pyrobaculum ferrireducens TaxID=1104324 RepID=G7VHK3_9CREN|nr:NUDIX hydrolase [Pyrobaculum ferrireducens]AET33294.1 NUDIX hydrolase [Pyrobaculum ferrireducens]